MRSASRSSRAPKGKSTACPAPTGTAPRRARESPAPDRPISRPTPAPGCTPQSSCRSPAPRASSRRIRARTRAERKIDGVLGESRAPPSAGCRRIRADVDGHVEDLALETRTSLPCAGGALQMQAAQGPRHRARVVVLHERPVDAGGGELRLPQVSMKKPRWSANTRARRPATPGSAVG